MALEPFSVAVIGGSIGGLAAATALHRLGARVKVFEASPAPFSGKGGSLGFCDNAMWERLAGRRMLRFGVPAHRGQGGYLYGDLWDFWRAGLPTDAVVYNASVSDLGPDPARPTIGGTTYDLAVLADGGWSSLRGRYFGPAAPVYAGHQIFRFRVEARHVPGFAAFGAYESAHFFSILLDIAQNDGREWIMGGTAIAADEADVVLPTPGASRQVTPGAEAPSSPPPSGFLEFYEARFGAMAGGELLRCLRAAAAHGKISPPMPQYEFAAARVVRGRLLLLGDAAHMASPRTGAGAHTAVLDAAALAEAFAGAARAGGGDGGAGGVIERALAAYEPPAIKRAAALLARSREASAGVAAPGWRRKDEL